MSWKENKMIGVVAGIVLLASLIVVFVSIKKKVKSLPKTEKHSIEKLPNGEEVPGPAVGIGE